MKKLGIFIVIALLFATTGCSDDEGSGIPSHNVYMTLENNSNEETHMWITGEQIGPNNKIAPGGDRNVTYTKSDELMIMDSGVREDVITVYAGRNGNVLASKTFSISYWDEFKTVRFNGSSVN